MQAAQNLPHTAQKGKLVNKVESKTEISRMKVLTAWIQTQPLGRIFQINVSILALFGLLAYTFVHTGGLLSRYIDPWWVGSLAAFGIEVSIVSLSLRIGELRKSGQKPVFYVGVLIAVLIVSALANVAEGFSVNQGVQLAVNTFNQVDWVQSIIGLAATGLIPLIVFALSEIIGTDVNVTVQTVQRERKAEQRRLGLDMPVTTRFEATPEAAEHARQAKSEQDAHTKAERLSRMVDILRVEPDIGVTALAGKLKISRTTAYGYLGELQETGRVSKNGSGWKVSR